MNTYYYLYHTYLFLQYYYVCEHLQASVSSEDEQRQRHDPVLLGELEHYL